MSSEKGIKIAVAESCTGGYISHMITNISGASNIFERGIVCYSNEAKIQLLGIDSGDIDEHGAVSETIAYQLARNVRINSSVDIGIGVTGIAGPTGGTETKPVGLVYIGYSSKVLTNVVKRNFSCSRIEFKMKVLRCVLDIFEKLISEEKS